MNVRVWHVSNSKVSPNKLIKWQEKNRGYLTSTFSCENFPETWCNTKLVMDAQNWRTRLAYTSILQISVHLAAKNKITLQQQQQKGFFFIWYKIIRLKCVKADTSGKKKIIRFRLIAVRNWAFISNYKFDPIQNKNIRLSIHRMNFYPKQKL